ncbi:MAG: substrate-binding domain-containing protein [Desulfobacteraceae bacterium]|nr:substrate-binding domain-containing protein [Desulfobacteraceae bacterium]
MFIRMVCVFLCAVFMWATPVLAGNENKIALVMKDLFNPFFLKMEAGAKEYAQKNNIPLEVFGVERETQVDRQIGIVDNLISRKYGAIVIAPADSKKLVPVCKKAIDKGIVVINIDNPFHKETQELHKIKIPFVGSDNRAGASMVGNYIKQKLKSKGRVIIVEGIGGVENADLRKKGFAESVTSEAQIEILASESANWHKDEAFSLMTGLLGKYNDVDAILCANDIMALGTIQALDMLGLTGKVWIGAYDNIDEARLEMQNKRMHATIEQHPELMGEYGVKLAARALGGTPAPDYTPTPLDLITYDSFDKKIGLSISDLSNPFFKLLYEGAQKAGELFGIKLVVADAKNDDARQLLDIQKLIQEKTDLIIINPTNVETVSPAIEIADASGIKVITVDRKSSRDDIVVSHIASDNTLGGQIAGEFIARQLKGKGMILELEGIPGTSAAHDRGTGFNQAIDKYPDIKVAAREVAHFDQKKARELIKQIVKKGISFDAVFAHNDSMILGAIEGFEGNPSKPPVFVGFDAIPEALEAIQQKKLSATVAQKPEIMGWVAVKNAVRILRGEKLPKETLIDLDVVALKKK